MAPPCLAPPWNASPVPPPSLFVACSSSSPSCEPRARARLPGHGRQRPPARWQRPHRRNAGVAWRGAAWRLASAELGQDGRGPKPQARPPPFAFARLRRPKLAVGQLFPRAGPVVIGKIDFSFLLLFGKRNTLEKYLYTHFGSKFVETNFC